MIRALLFIFLTAFCISGKSVDSVSERIQFKGHEFDAYIVDFSQVEVSLFWKDKNDQNYTTFGNLKQKLRTESKELLFATNAGMFDPNGKPVGLHIEHGEVLIKADTGNGNGNFYLKPNGIFGWKGQIPYLMETSAYTSQNVRLDYATQSGPMLLWNGDMHPAFREGSKNVYVRSGVGLLDGNKVVFAISRAKCNFYDFASLFRDRFGCKNALYLDGAISKMYLPELDRFETGGNFAGILAVSKKLK